MAPKPKVNVLSYRPSESDVKHARHCIKLNLIKISLSRAVEFKDEYYLVKYDDSVVPAKVEYFLKDFSTPATPANRKIFTEFEAYKKLYEIYREFYLRNTNVPEDEIKEEIIKSKEMEKKEETSKEKKKRLDNEETKRLLNYPNKQVDLFEMIEDCEKEKLNNET